MHAEQRELNRNKAESMKIKRGMCKSSRRLSEARLIKGFDP
jgi:hypothetical protein